MLWSTTHAGALLGVQCVQEQPCAHLERVDDAREEGLRALLAWGSACRGLLRQEPHNKVSKHQRIGMPGSVCLVAHRMSTVQNDTQKRRRNIFSQASLAWCLGVTDLLKGLRAVLSVPQDSAWGEEGESGMYCWSARKVGMRGIHNICCTCAVIHACFWSLAHRYMHKSSGGMDRAVCPLKGQIEGAHCKQVR
eukprot:1160365-Pelagomonas_calceolata.AAC.9